MISSLIDNAYVKFLRIRQNYRDRSRWKNLIYCVKEGPKVYYATENLPPTWEKVSGGMVKCQDLSNIYPNNLENPNILYLVSSALPVNAEELVRLAVRKKIKVVVNQNGVAYPAWHGKGWEKTNVRLKRILYSADYVIYQSKFCKKVADKFIGTVNCPSSILYNPVDTNRLFPTQTSIGKTLLVAGTHNNSYRVKLAIETLGYLRKSGHDFILNVAGPLNWDRNARRVKKEALQWCRDIEVEEYVNFLGAYSQDQVKDIFSNIRVLIHLQYNDVCPRLLVESMSCGVPVVYSKSGGSPEIVGNDAGIGLIVSEDFTREHYPKPDIIADAINKIVKMQHFYSDNARNRAVNKFDVSSWVNQHKSIFNSVLK